MSFTMPSLVLISRLQKRSRYYVEEDMAKWIFVSQHSMLSKLLLYHIEKSSVKLGNLLKIDLEGEYVERLIAWWWAGRLVLG